MRSFAVYFWHSEGWRPRNEALMEAVVVQARTTRHPWLVARDANMDPTVFFSKNSCGSKENASLLKRQKREHLRADPQAQKASLLMGTHELADRTDDYVIAGRTIWMWWKISSCGRTR